MSLLALRHLQLSAGDKNLVSDLTLEFEASQNWAVLGPNGTGKTTLLHCLAGLTRPGSGEIEIAGNPVDQIPHRLRAQQVSIVLQHYDDAFPSAVEDTVMAGRHPHLSSSLFATESGIDHQYVYEALRDMELEHLAKRSITTLSGGERRRVDIALLLAQDTPIRLLDEPCNHLDLSHQGSILNRLTRKDSQKKLNIFALHDVNHALQYCDHALLLFEDGSTQAGTIEATATQGTLEDLYRCRLKEITSGDKRLILPEFE
jgi:iron complex transport system ATP-binding protein